MGDCYLADIKQPSTRHNRQVFHIQSSSSLLREVRCNLSAPSELPALASKPMSNLPTTSPSPFAPSNEELKTSLREAFSTHAVEWDFLPNETSKRTPDHLTRGIEEAAPLVSMPNLRDETNGSTLPPPAKVIHIQPKDARPRGRASLGITSLASIGHLSSLQDEAVEVKWDSGADITLISKNCLARLTQPPKVTEGMKIQLYELTGKSKITGYVIIPLFVQAESGDYLKLEMEAYVVPEMTVPVLLGEDFMKIHCISVDRSSAPTKLRLTQDDVEYCLPTTSETPWTRDPSLHVRSKTTSTDSPKAYFLKAAEKKLRLRSRKLRRTTNSASPSESIPALPRAQEKSVGADLPLGDVFVTAAQDVKISAGHVAEVRVEGVPDEEKDWFIEKILLVTSEDDESFLGAPSTLIKGGKGVRLPVVNPSSRTRWIRKGERLGILHDPRRYLDREVIDDPRAKNREAIALAVRKLASSGPVGELELIDTPLKSKAGEPSAVDDPEAKDENWGPKISEPGDPTTIDSKNFESAFDLSDDIPQKIRSQLLEVLKKHILAFGFDDRLGNHPANVSIPVIPGTHPISVPMYSASPAKRLVIDDQIDKWIEQEVIQPSKSPWGAPVVIVYRNGKPRFCVDYRKLNKVTIPDEHPIPRQPEIMQALSGFQVFSSLDALSGFTQLTVKEEDREKTAFRTHRGLYEFKRLPFGLRNGPPEFQRVMQSILAPYLWTIALCYIDDIVVFSKSYEEHLQHLDLVLGAIAEAKLTLSPVKCHLGYSSILLLGQKVSRLGLSTHREKVEAIVELARPTSVQTLQSFIGMVVYFSHFIPYFSDIAAPLFKLLKKGTPWEWLGEHETAFESLKVALAAAPILAHPIAGLPYRVYSDASDVALGACVQQVQPIVVRDLKGTKTYESIMKAYKEGKPVPTISKRASKDTDDVPIPGDWNGTDVEDTIVQVERVISYWSRTLRPAEKNYSATERETLGVKEALVKFQPFIEGEKIIVITDHAALIWSRTYENANRRLATWGAVFAAYPGLDIVHRAGRVHSNVDPLSRLARIPSHQSPLADATKIMESKLPKAPAFSWKDIVEPTPASRAAFAAVKGKRTENENPKGAPTNTRTRSREESREQSTKASRTKEKINSRAKPESRASSGPVPSSLIISASKETMDAFRKGYRLDGYFRKYFEDETLSTDGSQSAESRYYRSDTGLLIFRDADWVARLCVPSSQVEYVLKLAHESASESAHAGASRLFLRLKDRFYWPSMWKDVLEFCQSCDVCQKINPDRRSPAGLLRPHKIPLLPWDVVSLDLITGLPNSNGFTAILVVVDKLTKYVLYIPTKNELKQEGFADLFLEHVVRRFGLPLEMIADRDPRWAKSFWQSIATSLGLKLLLSTSHHPQHDGQTERANQTLEIALRAFVAGERTNWSKWLNLLAHAYNSTPQTSTGYAPHFLLFGYSPRSELSLLDPLGRGIPRNEANNASAISFLHELDVHRARARDALAKAQASQAKSYNKGRRTEEFEVGDEVLVNPHSLELVEATKGTGRKLIQRRIGPFEITEKLSPTVYRLRLPASYNMHPVLNIEHLKKYDKSLRFTDRTVLPELRVLPQEEEYEVDKIVGDRFNKSLKRREYLVRWKGYGPEQDTFEPEKNLRNAFLKLRKYKRSE